MPQAGYRFAILKDAGALLSECGDVLSHRPALNHDVLQILDDISEKSDFLSPPYHFFALQQGNKNLGCGVSLRPDGLVLSDLPAEIAPLITDVIQFSQIEIQRLVGPPELVSSLAEHWSKKWNYKVAAAIHWNVGRLDRPIRQSQNVRGFMRRASSDDSALVEKWAREYATEKPSFLDIPRFMDLKLRKGDLFLWDDDGPSSLATVSGKTRQGVRISAVFTPNELRGQGYASSIVTELGAQLLNTGYEFVVLTWRKGADEGRIYERLGFVSAGVRGSYIFD